VFDRIFASVFTGRGPPFSSHSPSKVYFRQPLPVSGLLRFRQLLSPSNYFRSIIRSESDSTTMSNRFPLERTLCTVSFLMLLGNIGLNFGQGILYIVR